MCPAGLKFQLRPIGENENSLITFPKYDQQNKENLLFYSDGLERVGLKESLDLLHQQHQIIDSRTIENHLVYPEFIFLGNSNILIYNNNIFISFRNICNSFTCNKKCFIYFSKFITK